MGVRYAYTMKREGFQEFNMDSRLVFQAASLAI